MDVLKIAEEAGLSVLLDGRIGRQEYTSVSGSVAALLRFAEAIRADSTPQSRAPERRAP
jgi:hypothetical protein